jgi:Protein of unknown function (DUF1501)
MNRRVFLRAGLLAPIGLGLADAIRLRSVAHAAPQRTGSARACILLYMTGGPAQHETFDPKPNSPESIRGEFRPIATNVPGIQTCVNVGEVQPTLEQPGVVPGWFKRPFAGSAGSR